MSITDNLRVEEYRLKLLLADPLFHASIHAIRRKLGIPEDGFKTSERKALNTKRSSLSREKRTELEIELLELTITFGLSARWTDKLEWYLYSNTHGQLRNTPHWELAWDFEAKGARVRPDYVPYVWIKADADTTESELREALAAAKDYLPSKGKKQLYANANHAIRARELRATGKKWRDVADIVNEEFQSKYLADSMQKAVNRLENYIKKNRHSLQQTKPR